MFLIIHSRCRFCDVFDWTDEVHYGGFIAFFSVSLFIVEFERQKFFRQRCDNFKPQMVNIDLHVHVYVSNLRQVYIFFVKIKCKTNYREPRAMWFTSRLTIQSMRSVNIEESVLWTPDLQCTFRDMCVIESLFCFSCPWIRLSLVYIFIWKSVVAVISSTFVWAWQF